MRVVNGACTWSFKGKFWYKDSYDFEKDDYEAKYEVISRSTSGDVKVWLVRNFVEGKKFLVTSEKLDFEIENNRISVPAWRGKTATEKKSLTGGLLGNADAGEVLQ